MRLERRGGPPNLQAAFKAMILDDLRGRSLDDNHAEESAKGKFPDFACFQDLLLVEMKHLETDQHDRVNRIFDEKIDPTEKPLFYGSRDARFLIDVASNREAINAAIFSKLGRTIETILNKASQQFVSYRSRHPRKNTVNICTILNSTLREFTPEVIIHAIHRKMKADQPNEPRFPAIDAVLYISEKHFQILPDERVAYPIAIYEAAGAINQSWKIQFVDRVVDAWSRARTSGPAEEGHDLHGFETVHDIPESMKRHEAWSLEYQRNPYMGTLSVERLRVLFNIAIAVNSLTFIKGSWPKPTTRETAEGLRMFQHIIEETNRRGIDLRLLDRQLLTPEEKDEVYGGFPVELVQVLMGSDTTEPTVECTARPEL